MSGFELCVLYTALKLHFAPGPYDYFHYCGKVNLTPETYEHRKDRWFFHKLASKLKDKETATFFMAANFFSRKSLWVRDLLEEESQEIYRERLRVRDSLFYIVNEDLEMTLADPDGTLTVETVQHALKVVDGENPELLTAALQGNIHTETLIVLNAAINFFPVWEKKITDTILFPAFKNKCLAYQPFLGIDVKKFRETLKTRLTKPLNSDTLASL